MEIKTKTLCNPMRIRGFTCWTIILIINPCADIMPQTIGTAHDTRSCGRILQEVRDKGHRTQQGCCLSQKVGPFVSGFPVLGRLHMNSLQSLLSLPMTLMGELNCFTGRIVPLELQRQLQHAKVMLPLRRWHGCENGPKTDRPRETIQESDS